MTGTPVTEETPEGLPDLVVEDTRRLIVVLLEEESSTLRMEVDEQGADFHEALLELDTKKKSTETDKNKGSDPGGIDQLTIAVKDARRDANHALEELKKSCDDADEGFGRVATHLKPLETRAYVGPSGQEATSSENENDALDRECRRDRSRRAKVVLEAYSEIPILRRFTPRRRKPGLPDD